MKHLSEFWWLYVGVLGSGGYLWHLLKRRGGDEPLQRRLIFVSSPKHDPKSPEYDPKSPEYDPGLVGRQLVLVVVGLGLVGFVNLVIWVISSR